MPSWSAAVDAAPDLSASVRARFEASGLGLLATLRADGFPRISGVEPLFDVELWLGMMPRSRKAADLVRDPRLCLHSATADKEVTEGDAKLSGRAVAVTDQTEVAAFRARFAAQAGMEPPPGPMDLFRVDVTDMSFLRPAGDHLVIEWWRDGEPVSRVDRY